MTDTGYVLTDGLFSKLIVFLREVVMEYFKVNEGLLSRILRGLNRLRKSTTVPEMPVRIGSNPSALLLAVTMCSFAIFALVVPRAAEARANFMGAIVDLPFPQSASVLQCGTCHLDWNGSSGLSYPTRIDFRAPLKIQTPSLCCVAHKKLLLTYQTYAASQFFARALPSLGF